MTQDIVREYVTGAFRGDFPDVPVAAGVDLDAIRQRDDDAMFVTLPIAEIGAVSNNGLLYDDSLVATIAEQINTNRPGGIFGHIAEGERNTRFELPAGLWVGALRVGNTLWAKAYIPPGAARDYVRNLKAVGGQIATSIYGKGTFEKVREGVNRLKNFALESLDFAPPARAALGYGAIPHVTSEMSQEQEAEMPDIIKTVEELAKAKVKPISGWNPGQQEQVDEASTVAELTAKANAQQTVIAELQQQLEGMRVERINSLIASQVAELTDWQVATDDGKAKLAKLRELLTSQIVTRMGSDLKAERVAEMATAAWDDIKPIAEMVRDALAGPAAVVNGRVQATGARKPIEDTPENRERALAAMGISI